MRVFLISLLILTVSSGAMGADMCRLAPIHQANVVFDWAVFYGCMALACATAGVLTAMTKNAEGFFNSCSTASVTCSVYALQQAPEAPKPPQQQPQLPQPQETPPVDGRIGPRVPL